MFKDITTDNQEIYEITKPGEYIFYFENKNGDITFSIMCENAEVKIYGLYHGKNTDQFTLTIRQNHTAPNSKSMALIKSVLDDKSVFTFTDTIHIDKKAKNSVVHLTNNNLLLSQNARAITLPQLEVIPDNVECTHSAKTAPLQSDHIYYLMARGLTKNETQKILVNGFIDEIRNKRKK